MQQEQRNVVYHPRTDDSYRPPPQWQKTLKQQRGLIFTNGMHCTVNKRAERVEEERPSWLLTQRGADLSTELATKLGRRVNTEELNETFSLEEMQRMLTFKYTFIFHKRVGLMQHCRLVEEKKKPEFALNGSKRVP